MKPAMSLAGGDSTDRGHADGTPDEEQLAKKHRGKAGLFWGGAGIGLALYSSAQMRNVANGTAAANEASVQVQELVRDLQGYDDEF